MGISWDVSVLYPQSIKGILANLGVIINAFGFMLILFPLYVFHPFTHSIEKHASLSETVGEQTRECVAHCVGHLVCYYGSGPVPHVS